MKDVEKFAKTLWARCQSDLEQKYLLSKETHKKLDPHSYELVVYSCAACIDLMFWAVRDDTGTVDYFMF